jgi:restriction system protein
MPIPDFQTLMRPLLDHFSDGRDHPNDETLEALATQFHLTTEERAKLLPSGKQPVFVNKVAWAKSHMKAAGLIESPQRAVYRITPRGRELLARHPDPINMKVLEQFPGYQEFRAGRPDAPKDGKKELPNGGDDLTPEEHIDYGYQQIRTKLVTELLDRVRSCPPAFFESLVVELLVAMGYGGSRADAGKAVGKAGDGGIDGIIKEDRLGLDTIYIQAKRWEGTVGRPEIQKFAGALQGVRARKGIFITSSSFTNDAAHYAGQIESKIVLIDGQTLAGLMIDHDIGVARVQAYEIKRLDSDYFQSAE